MNLTAVVIPLLIIRHIILEGILPVDHCFSYLIFFFQIGRVREEKEGKEEGREGGGKGGGREEAWALLLRW